MKNTFPFHFLNLIFFWNLPSLVIMGTHLFQSDPYAGKILKSGKSQATVETSRKYNYCTVS